ncbi:hypothetical protein KJ605_00105 [Patescibacteria group bacterium]|nr:hypothetical protein [Patescibacteria group bacterium]MBU1970173.1 hypothetical protein [Patescibacteria group bacterium]
MTKQKTSFAIVTCLFLVIAGVFYFRSIKTEPNTLKIPFPFTTDVSNSTSFACESLASATVIGGQKSYINGIEAQVEKGTDAVAMSIKDEETLVFTSGTAVKAGMAEGEEFMIIQNDNKTLMAVSFPGKAINTVVLNKTNGLAAWLKGNPEFPLYEAPYGGVIYMVCR